MKHKESWRHVLPFSCYLAAYLLLSQFRRPWLRISLSFRKNRKNKKKKKKKIVLAFEACNVVWEQQTLGAGVGESRAIC